jgi:hypothetical protein
VELPDMPLLLVATLTCVVGFALLRLEVTSFEHRL